MREQRLKESPNAGSADVLDRTASGARSGFVASKRLNFFALRAHADEDVRAPSSRASVLSAALLVLIVLGLTSLPGVVIAKEAVPNEDPQIEQRMKNLTEQLRCLVCQNETLADSHADLAEDLRTQIRQQMKAGKTDNEIIAYLTDRYGDFVLYKPPVKATTYLLWFGPFILLGGGTVVLYRYLSRRRKIIEERPLSPEERRQAAEILRSV